MQLRFTQSYRSHLDDIHTLNILFFSKEKDKMLFWVNARTGKKFSTSKEVTNVAQERHESGRQIQAPSELRKAEVPRTKQKHILSSATPYHPIYTKSSRHNTAPTEKEGWRYLLEALRTAASGDVLCQVN